MKVHMVHTLAIEHFLRNCAATYLQEIMITADVLLTD